MLTVLLTLVLVTTPPDAQLVASVEKEFYQQLKLVDKQQSQNLTAQFRRIFKQQHSSPYQLHREFVLIDRKAEQEAKAQAKAHGYKEREYTQYIGGIRDNYVSSLMKRYKLTVDLRTAFMNNYCFCYVGKAESYCNEGKCKLDSSI